jgi:hypothetical protein
MRLTSARVVINQHSIGGGGEKEGGDEAKNKSERNQEPRPAESLLDF